MYFCLYTFYEVIMLVNKVREFIYTVKKTTPLLTSNRKIASISKPSSWKMLRDEVAILREKGYMLFKSSDYEAYCCPSAEMPIMMHTIACLREQTFREIGEGSNLESDHDKYDLYYQHIFLWDYKNNQLVGAYRIGQGDYITKHYGKKGFYTHTLYKFKDEIMPLLEQSIELGRSFVVKDYQRKALPLFLLWKAIMSFLLKHPQYRYLLGPVSISNSFSKTAKSLIIQYIKRNHFDNELAQYIKPRNKFKIKKNSPAIEAAIKNIKDINGLEKAISELDALQTTVPVLLKKYIEMSGKVVAFNIDPKFNFAIDGFLVIDKQNLPEIFVKFITRNLAQEAQELVASMCNEEIKREKFIVE